VSRCEPHPPQACHEGSGQREPHCFGYARPKTGLSQDVRLMAQVRGPTRPGSGNVKLVTPNKCPQRSFPGGLNCQARAPSCAEKGHVRSTSFRKSGCGLQTRVTGEQLIRMLCFPVHKDFHAHEGLCGKVRRYARSRFAHSPSLYPLPRLASICFQIIKAFQSPTFKSANFTACLSFVIHSDKSVDFKVQHHRDVFHYNALQGWQRDTYQGFHSRRVPQRSCQETQSCQASSDGGEEGRDGFLSFKLLLF